jgi:hypothetical protein
MAHGKKTGGRKPGSKNKATLAREAEAAAAADGGPRAVPSLTKILKFFLGQADAEAAKEGGGNPAIITAMLVEARITATALAIYQSPRLSAVAVGQVTKMTVVVKGGLPPRRIEALPAPAPTALAKEPPLPGLPPRRYAPLPAIAPPATGTVGPDDAGGAQSETSLRA